MSPLPRARVQSQRKRIRRSLAPALLLALGGAAAACSGAATPSSRPAVRAAELPPPEPPELPSPARWVDSSGVTLVGPAVPGGTLALLGGRRVVVGPGGAARAEAAPGPEPILEIVEVPSTKGTNGAKGGPRWLVARGARGVYRLDDPLGAPTPLARSEGELRQIGGAPGLVAVWERSADLPRFLDVETGAIREMPGLPLPPLGAIAFRDARHGAAIFEAAGLAVTADGGASWRLVSELAPGDALRVRGLRLRGEEIRAFVHADGRDAVVDVGQARLGAMEDAPPAGAEAPLLRWARVTGRDPLEAAVASGVPLSPGVAMAASHGLLARVDLRAGVVLDLSEFASGSGVNLCGVGSSARVAWVACALSEEGQQDLHDPFGVLRVPLGAGRLAADRPALTRSGEADLRASPSGGVMLLGPCNADDDGIACVRQPGGRWVTLQADVDLHDRGAGPLADGRVALLRGLWDGDVPQGAEAGAGAGAEQGRGGGGGVDEEEAARAQGPYVAVLGLDGKERRVAAVAWPGGAAPAEGSDLRVASPIEESEEHALSFVMARGDELWAVVQPPGREVATLTRLAGASHARVHQGHGVAVGEGQVLGSLDAGISWAPVATPDRVLQAIQRVDLFDEPGVLAVNAVGMKIDTQLRLGWGPASTGAAAEPASTAAPPAAGAPLPRRAPPPSPGPELALGCASQGPGQGTPPLVGANQVSALLAGGARGAQPAPKGSERRVSTATAGRWGMLDAVAVLEEQGEAKPGALPATWTLRWFDPTELGGKPRAWSGPPPKGVSWGATLRAVSAQGSRALFTLRAGGSHLLARVEAPGSIEFAEVPWEMLPGTEVVFGTDRGEPIAWLHDTALVVWVSGERPRVVASVATHAARTLGQPTRDGVPLLLSASDWALWRTMPLAPASAPAPAPAPAPSSAPSSAPRPVPVTMAAAIPLDGWAAAPNVRRDLGLLPACGPRPKGARFLLQRLSGSASVDGQREHVQGAVYDVRVAGADACVAQVTALLAPEGAAVAAPPAPAAPGKPVPGKPVPGKGAPASGPVAFARVDLTAKRAEGGERGPGGTVRRLACGLEPRR